jgi:uncharacterized RDD family membrane protein YckC
MNMKSRTGIELWLLTALCVLVTGAGLHAQEAREETGAVPAPPEAVQPEEPAGQAGADAPVAAPRRTVHREAMVLIGKDAELKAGETAEVVVVIGGSARILGEVQEAVVVIGGDAFIDGEVGDAVVSVLGGIKAGPGARVGGEAVAVGGKVELAEGASIAGRTQEVDIGSFALPRVEWLRDWFRYCVLMLRPLAPQVGWLMAFAGLVFLLYFLIALAFPRPVHACVDELTRRPATTFLLGILAKLLVPLILVILAATGVGLIAAPFIIAAALLAAIVGKVAILEWLGLKIGKQTNAPILHKPLVAFIIGAVILLLVYMIPIVGLIAFAVMSVWGFGAAVTASFGGLRREMPEKSAAPPPPRADPAMAMPVAAYAGFAPPDAAGNAAPGWAGSAGAGNPAASFAPATTLPKEPPVMLPDALAYPKATFWERLGAMFLDVVLVSILATIVGGLPWGLLVALAYFAGMWAWKGTTIGGIVLGLKVARMDGQPVTFSVSLVRALAAAFSSVVLFLGFLWIAWDADKQGWHDKIAGTVVVRMPRGTPLVCL